MFKRTLRDKWLSRAPSLEFMVNSRFPPEEWTAGAFGRSLEFMRERARHARGKKGKK